MSASDFSDFEIKITRHDTHLFNFQVQLNGVNQDTSLWTKFWFTAKKSIDDTDANAVMQLTSLPNGGIDPIDTAVGTYRVTISSINTDSLDNNYKRLYCDIQGSDEDGKVWTL